MSVGEVEYHFYQQAARELTQAGVSVPTLLSADPDLRRLRLEYPCEVNQDDVSGDEILATWNCLVTLPVRNGFTTTMHGQNMHSNTLCGCWHCPTKMHNSFGVFDNAVMFCLVIRV
jgi:hypothetical protein